MTGPIAAWRRCCALLVAAAVVGTALAATNATIAQAETTRHEAELALLTGGATAAADHAGYTGSGFVDGYTDGNKGTATTSFAVEIATDAEHTLTLRYANGTGSPKTLTLIIDGAAQQVSLPATANWDDWATHSVSVDLTSGAHTVAYRFGAADSGNVNLDNLEVAPPPQPGAGYSTGPVFEAEAATLAGGAVVASDHAGYSGSGFVGGYTDANSGSASTTFKVRISGGGAVDLVFRYANGTPTDRTLSLVVDGAHVDQLSFPTTSNWDTWDTVTVARSLPEGDHDITLLYGSADNGNVNLDRLDVVDGGEPQPAGPGEAEDAYVSGGAVVTAATGGHSGTGYVEGFTAEGARVVRALGVESAGTATATIRFTTPASDRSLDLLVNARVVGTVDFPSGTGWRTTAMSVPVRAGVNTVGLRAASAGADVFIDSIDVSTQAELAARGATTTYRQYEAEAGSTDGTVLTPSRTYGTVASESSGRSAVRLDTTGEHVSIALASPANGLVLRYSIPDNATGTGLSTPLGLYADGTKLTDVTLTSEHSWLYGAYPYLNDPNSPRPEDRCGPEGGACVPHRFFDEVRVQLPDELPAGTVLRLQKDSAATSHIDIDLVEAEVVPPPLTRPSDALSIIDFGARSGQDATTAINAAVAQARQQRVPVWIPEGDFRLTSAIQVSDVTVLGAGPWYSSIEQTNGRGGFYGSGGGVAIADLAILGDLTVRLDDASDTAIEGDFASDTLIQNVWIQHTKTALWVRPGSKDVLAVGLRVRDTYADGVNLRSSENSRVVQSTFRNTGDDAMAMWSSDGPGSRNTFAFNTVQTPALSNGIAVYGGGPDNRVEDNLVADIVSAGAGISISTRFGVPFSGTTHVRRNTLERAGSREPGWPAELGALWIYADIHPINAPIVIRDMTITDSTFSGVHMSWEKSIDQVSFERVRVDGTGTYGLLFEAPGTTSFADTTVLDTTLGGLSNPSDHTIIRGEGNSGF
ncbi:CBM35 domain-containing protein [Myceligenerans pegani]|uniref:Carbohydrate-binding protein n=1 Tax=Myceligenerans pegani TaxID=2776917 RepID=A0ABR9MWC0_9MICO|nr:CBM35 domain-containing protein [Myceligenerans sp. TRM 65318]MBE1875699.1 carbohydrate-binding protein [Myceligenerans sp. TRM 65318]MBE3017970.1 carbohydrate-binding protein [Myceligenerans sp. TRM 65318]